MICLRFWRPLAALFAPFGLAALPRVLLLGLLAAPGPFALRAGASSARSRTHRLTPSSAPLHYTERSFASPHGKPKGKADTRFEGKSKAGHGGLAGPAKGPAARGKAAKGSAGTRSTGTHKAPKHGGKHARDAEFEAPVPMLRVSHGKPGGHGAPAGTKAPRYERKRQSTEVPLVPRAVRAPAAPSPAAPSPAERHAASSSAAMLPSLAATVPVVAIPAPAPPLHVVDGFGSELAFAPASPSDHPGLTRRRNHPASASALSEDARSSTPAVLAASLPSSLAERDAITAGAMAPSVLPSLSSNLPQIFPQNVPQIYDGGGRLVMPAPLRGSREILVHQNTMADNDGLERISDDLQLDRLRAAHQLLDLPVGNSLHVNENLPLNRRCARPWTALFAQDIARDFYARFHSPLWVTSAVRTVAFQSRLLRVNGNAAGLSGDFASPHLTGQAIDFGKGGMTAAQIAWMRSYLLPLIQSGKIDVEEEFHQACFHISVYRRYAGGRRVVNEVVQASSRPAPYPPLHQPIGVLPRPATVLTNPETTDIDP